MTVALGSIRIVSKRKGGASPLPGESIVDVDRSNPVLGNPHVLHDHRNEDERARVIAAYAKDFREDVAAGGRMLGAVRELAQRLRNGERMALRCWCAPRPCHAEIIRGKVYELAGIDSTSVDHDREQAALF